MHYRKFYSIGRYYCYPEPFLRVMDDFGDLVYSDQAQVNVCLEYNLLILGVLR